MYLNTPHFSYFEKITSMFFMYILAAFHNLNAVKKDIPDGDSFES